MSDSDAIRVEGLGKRYRLGLVHHDLLADRLKASVRWAASCVGRMLTPKTDASDEERRAVEAKGGAQREPAQATGHPVSTGLGATPEYIWAIKDVSFSVERGDVLGVIGRNGAGKSTLLKIMAGITEPTEGRVWMNGRIGSLLEVGTGFHPELTGRENIFLSGAMLGMKKAEIRSRFDDIVEFSGVAAFIDTPVKRYSSGMYVRLAFAVAAHLEPEILLVDEVLAVGDAEFQRKCIGKMKDVGTHGRTVLFVSHNMPMIQTLCPEALLIEDGHLRMRGPSREVVQAYLRQNTSGGGEYLWQNEGAPSSDDVLVPMSLRILDDRGRVSDRVLARRPFHVEFEYRLTQAASNLRVGLTLQTLEGEWVFCSFDRDRDQDRWYDRAPGRYLARCTIPANLLNGKAFVLGVISGIKGSQKLYRDYELVQFTVDMTGGVGSHWGGGESGGVIRPDLDWETRFSG